MNYHEAKAAGLLSEYRPAVGISSWDDERGSDRYDDDDDDGCRCRTYATPSGTGDGYGGNYTETDGCPIHDPDLNRDERNRDDEGGMRHDYGLYCECTDCAGVS